MNFFESVKQAVTTKQAAEAYGLEVDRHGMALCPFHGDHHPSLKLDERYYCFGWTRKRPICTFALSR